MEFLGIALIYGFFTAGSLIAAWLKNYWLTAAFLLFILIYDPVPEIQANHGFSVEKRPVISVKMDDHK
jgi:hypothetical protein